LTTVTVATSRQRIDSIDALRGTIMIIMALDHVRDMIHRAAMSSSPTDLATTTPILFLTRWVTHICAPVFMFTAGLGVYLWWKRGRTKVQLSTFLATRGLWLVFLELTVMRLAYNFDFAQSYPILLVVLWALGGCMILMSILVWLPVPVLAVLSVATIGLHNLLDGIQASTLGTAAPLWNVIHQPGAFPVGKALVFVAYPLVPWVAVMALGFSFGPFFRMEPGRRRRYLLGIGAAMIVAFLVVRGINVYGDPAPWSTQRSATFTALSFLNTTKYPPSLAFLLMTLGPALIMLGLFDRISFKSSHPMIVFGRVPLYYFVIHFYLAHIASAVLALAKYGSAAWAFVFHPVPSMGGPAKLFPPDFGFDLWVAYAVWAAIVTGLYPACRWFAGVKARRKDWWLSYL
jgi:uncharacterized membrane protein